MCVLVVVLRACAQSVCKWQVVVTEMRYVVAPSSVCVVCCCGSFPLPSPWIQSLLFFLALRDVCRDIPSASKGVCTSHCWVFFSWKGRVACWCLLVYRRVA